MESYQSPNTPLRIDTEWFANANSPSTSFSPTGPSGRDVPALRVSTSPTRTSFEKPPPSPRKDTSLKNTSRGNESKKLLAHVLEQIKDRNMPPSVYDALSSAAEISNEKKLGSFIDRAVKRRDAGKDRKAALYADDESEDEDERVFSTDTTLELMTRLRELLIISASQGWRIFDDGISQDPYMQRTSSGGRFSSPFRRSLQPGGKRSRSPSPDPKARDTTSTGLLTQCISAIASVVSEDCRFQIASPSPSRPPYALQAVTLEVAQFLLHTYRRASEIVSQIVFALIPAFSTFPREMHARLLAFFEECVTRNALEELSLIQGVRGLKSAQGPRQQIEEQNETLVSIRVDEAFDDPLSPGTSEWTPWTRIGAQLVSLRSTNSPFQSPSTYDYASFFSPLLAAILENIDFVRSRVEVLQRLYRLLDAIITLKLDAHLDVLEIIAYHTPNARRSATCLLTTFWPKAVGHVISCVDFYQNLFSLTEQNVKNGGYEDVSIIYSSLSTQLQIINNGLELGSIVLSEGNSSRSQTQEVPVFRLHDLLAWCEHYLSSETLPVSPVISEYLEENHVFRRNLNMMFEWSNLVYIASAIKTTFTPRGPLPPTSEMLSVSALQESSLDPEENNSPFEVVSLAHMRDVLGYEFNVHLDAAAKLLLSHMHHVGLFDRIDLEPKLFLSEAQDTYCSFPLPIGLDESPDVEALFASVEACLSDLDLSVNEVGLLLLCRRLWPSGMASDYALTRLTRSIISWVLSEDKDLATILRDYLARQRALPGVRSASDPLPWPSVPNGRPAPSSSVNNGGDYVASRKALVSRYAIPWLLALHHQNSENYCNILYDICAELVDDETDLPTDLFSEVPDHDVKAHAAQYHDKVLRSLTRLLHNSLTFTVSEKLFVRWLSSLSNSGIISYPIPSLVRLFQRDHQDHRYSIMDKPLPISESSEFDPWHHILASAETFNGLTNSICWLSVVASSGVDVSVATYFHFANLVESFKLPVSSSLVFMNAIFKSVWLRHAGRQQMQKIISDLHFRLDSEIVQSLKKKEMCHDAVLFIKQSLVTCLLLYGCDREKLQSTDLVTKDDIKDLPHRRILGRESQLLDPIVVDTVLMNALASYVAANVDEVTCIIAKFLNIFITESPTLESHEVDNFILRNGQMMTNCAFKFYDIQSHDISTLRTSFLLRVAVVDTQPLQELLEEWFRPNEDWKLRLSALVKLFRIILDVTSPAFTVEGRQWRSTITEVFYYFFSTLWADEKEELRLAADTFSSNLLPAHFEQISLCWSELLAKSPIADRVKLVSFLIQLRPHFPSWHMVSWESIVEIIAEDQYDQDAGNDGPLSAHLSLYGLSSKEDPVTERSSADSELISLRISIVLLSLDMIAEGIRIDYNDLLRIKQHVAQILGFADVHAIPAANGHSFFVEFDAHHPLLITDAELQGFVNDRAWPLLVGSPYVDILLHLFDSEIHELPGLTLKGLLESLGVIIYKHNIENVYLRHLQPQLKRAVSRVQEIMLKDIDYECRQVALSVLQSYIKKYQGSLRSFVHFAIEQVAKLVVSQSHLNQDPLVLQAKAFIDSMLTAYCNNGIFIGLIRRQLDRSLFVVLKQVLDANAKESGSQHLLDTILYDTFRRAVETDQNFFQVMLNNLQTFVEVVHHQNYSAETMTFVGQSLTYLTRRISEWSPEVVNPAPLLLIAALLIQHNKAQSRDFLSYTDTVLRAVLTRMLVDGATLSRLVQVTATLYRKGPSVNGEPSNNIIPVIFEILNEGLRVKARVLSGTINSMLETVMSTNINGSTTPALSHSNLFVGLALPGIHFLYNYSWTDHRTDNDFQASLTVAKVLLRVSSKDPDILMKFVDVSTEKTGPQNTSIRAWNILLLAVLQDSSGESINMIFSHLATFSLVHHAALRPYTTRPGAQIPESAITDINHAYIAIKVWLIVAQIKAARDGAGSTDALIVWNELYSVFESLIHFFEAEFRAGLSSTLAMLTWSTVADLFLFLRHLPSPVVLHTSSQISLLERLKPLGRGEAHTGKLARTIRSMAEKPLDMPFETMSNQVANDIVAAEKLRILEALNREVIPERRGARTQITLDSNR
ncbi:hypothetical protein LENED_012563 [Lentinula edodes]|uniref:Uncharacterized protein n=1 Tax=Lentinula edodes TaxID=5353 RepID=A0A1Q3ESX3_LENED|nr:hypothetical protein LENED_012563 [Lentinula edodes]